MASLTLLSSVGAGGAGGAGRAKANDGEACIPLVAFDLVPTGEGGRSVSLIIAMVIGAVVAVIRVCLSTGTKLLPLSLFLFLL
jgi:hypothetical protein